MFPRWSAPLVVVLVAVLAAGCSGSDKPRAANPATARPTPLTKLDTASLRIARATFCDQVAAAEVRRALGAKPDADERWGNGDPVPSDAPGGPGTGSGSSPATSSATSSGDVGHELGCGWMTTAGSAARAWAFARPVTSDFAGTLVAQATHQPGCTAEHAPQFGSPALLQTCTAAGGTERVRRAGLFGDTWLTCELAGPAASRPRARLDDWCAAVVAALDAG